MAKPILYGPDGNPIDRAALLKVTSGPLQGGGSFGGPASAAVRAQSMAWMSGDPSAGLTPGRLGQILRQAEMGEATAYLELAERLEEKDLHYLAELSKRKRAVSQLRIKVEAASDKAEDVAIADDLDAWLKTAASAGWLFDMLDAVAKGYAVLELLWDISAGQWRPRPEWRDPRWFRFDPADGRTLRLIEDGSGGLRPLPAIKFITHHHAAKSGLPIRGGLARACCWGYLFKNFSVRDWAIFLEGYGHPMRIGKYHPGASVEDRETLLEAVAGIGVDRAAIIPDGMLIEFIKADVRASSDLYERMADWVDAQVSKAILGQTLTAQVGSSGSYAAASVHNEVREDIRDSDVLQVEQTLARDLVRPYVDLNFGPRALYPTVRLTVEQPEDLKLLSEALIPFIDRGLEVEQSVILDRFGLPAPAAGAKMLRPAGGGGGGEAATIGGPAAQRALHGAGGWPAEDADAIDRLAALALDGWHVQAGEILEPVARLLDDCASVEEFDRRFGELAAAMQPTKLADALARALFVARVGGNLTGDKA